MQASTTLQPVSPDPGNFRLKVLTASARSVLIGPFNTLAGAHLLARDLIADGSAASVIVQQQGDDGAWREVR